MNESAYTIAAVEREVGLSKDVLRAWERRYGFPAPLRDGKGERLYPPEQVQRLRRIKRLMDRGYRPGRLLSGEQLDEGEGVLAARSEPGRPASALPPHSPDEQDDVRELLGLLGGHDVAACLRKMHQLLARAGLRRFVLDVVAPLANGVGREWEEGRLQVFEEHLATELLARVLRQAIAAVPRGSAPRVLLTTLPGEAHGLGLLMVEAVLALEGACCISLGTGTPMLDIAGAASAHRADVVALSFSSAFATRQVAPLLRQARETLPPQIEIWAGGSGAARAGRLSGVRHVGGLERAETALSEWRSRHGAAAGDSA